MPNCVRCLTAYQGEHCAHCPTDFKHISKGLIPSDTMAEGGAGLFPAAVEIPDRDTPDYIAFLEDKLSVQQHKLKQLKEENKLISMESELRYVNLGINREELQQQKYGQRSGFVRNSLYSSDTGDRDYGRGAADMLLRAAPNVGAKILRKEEEAALSKIRPLSYLVTPKGPDKCSYREFMSGMTHVLTYIINLGHEAKGYAAHMKFIASKAATNVYITEYLIRYEMAVTDKVFGELLPDWVSADPECIAIHLGAEATYAIQGKTRWGPNRGSSAFGNSPSADLSSWPKDICWLYNTRQCNIQSCNRLHVCAKCRSKEHLARECTQADKGAPNSAVDNSRTTPAKSSTK